MKQGMTRLRLVQAADAAQISQIYATFCRETAISFETVPPDEATMRNRISKVADRYPWLVAVSESGVVIGYAYASQHRERAAYRWSVDFTVYLAPAARGLGIGTDLYRALAGICRSLGYCRAFAGIALPNPASVGLHEKIGFRPIGVYQRVGFKLGKWHDVGWWGLDLLTEAENPEEPRGIGQLVGSAVFAEIIGGG